MYFGAGVFLITVGMILIFVPRDTTRTIPLDLVGGVLIALGAAGLLANVVRRLPRRRAKTRLEQANKPATTSSTSLRRRRRRNT